MSDLNDRSVAASVVAVAERIAERTITRLIAKTRYGVVAGAADPATRTVSVRLYGQNELSTGFVYGTETPLEADLVRVLIDPRGDRYVAAILGRDALPPAQLVDALPEATEALRGQLRLVRGGIGVADGVWVCRKNASEAYEWAAVT